MTYTIPLTRNQRGAKRHWYRIGGKTPVWMMIPGSLDGLWWARIHREFNLRMWRRRHEMPHREVAAPYVPTVTLYDAQEGK